MYTDHFLDCEGVMCQDDPTSEWKDNVVWYPDEPICQKVPLEKWQKTARKIQKLYKSGKLKYGLQRYFTATMLEALRRVNEGVKGKGLIGGIKYPHPPTLHA